MFILQRERRHLERVGHGNRFLWTDGFTRSTEYATIEAEFRFLIGFCFGRLNHGDGGSRTVAAAESTAGAFFDIVCNEAAKAFGADSVFEGVTDGCGFPSEDGTKDFAFHCSRSWHVFFSHSLRDGKEPVHYPWPSDDDADQE
jgi:hypothetical protein